MIDETMEAKSGLEGVVAARTRLSSVEGDIGRLVIAGYPVEELAPRARFEETLHLLLHGRLPRRDELDELRERLAAAAELPDGVVDLLRSAARNRCEPMDALRMGAAALDIDGSVGEPMETALTIAARIPMIVATYWRLLQGGEPVSPASNGAGIAARYLAMLDGRDLGPARTRALETYLNTVIDHGLNASTFTARVVASTGSDLVSAIAAAVGALKGPLHGGAPGPALEMVFEIGGIDRAEEYLRAKLARGERLMGFGHRVYRVRDPRADVLAAAARELFAEDADTSLYELATGVERIALRLLEEAKPGRRLQTNVEFYTALLLHGLGLPVELFTPTFAVGRVAGWLAHALEQRREGRLIRPSSVYSGPTDAQWIPIEDR
jgi:citrate synthase